MEADTMYFSAAMSEYFVILLQVLPQWWAMSNQQQSTI